MPADQPTILATSGGIRRGQRTEWEFNHLVHYAVELSGTTAAKPRVCFVNTACGDDRAIQHNATQAGRVAGFDLTHLALFPMPNVADIEGHLMEQDVVWVWGGSVANLLAVWRIHRMDEIFSRVWQAGVVLGGVSAGSICWHIGGSTDSFGLPLQPVTSGLAMLPYGNGVHYDSEETRRPTIQRLVAEGILPLTYCTDDGVGLVYRGTELAEVVAERNGAAGYVVTRDGEEAVEEQLPTRLLR